MQKAIQTQHQISAPAESIWDLIRTGSNWEKWFPILTGSRVEGNSRYCDLENGDTLEESFLASNVEKTFIYTIHKQASFPAENIVGILRLEEKTPSTTNLHWSVEMDVADEASFQALKTQIVRLYEASAAKLGELALVAQAN
ncbi:MAG: SRPBCC family protein [Bacteroidota bacterium]